MRLLCIGYGSIGKRHSSILRELGHAVTSVDPNPLAGAEYGHARSAENLLGSRDQDSLVVHWDDFDGVLDCTPADIRATRSLPARARFIEKPLGDMRPARGPVGLVAPVQMGFCYRWCKSLETFRESLADVRVYSLTMIAGSWLPDWHPGVDYRTRYHGTPGRGGVVLDSMSHSLFVARWLMGELELVGAVVERLGSLDIFTEDTAGALLRTRASQPIYILTDYLRRPGGSHIEAVTSAGVAEWKFNTKEAPQMYLRQMQIFCEICTSERQYGYPNLHAGICVQRLLDEIAQYGIMGQQG